MRRTKSLNFYTCQRVVFSRIAFYRVSQSIKCPSDSFAFDSTNRLDFIFTIHIDPSSRYCYQWSIFHFARLPVSHSGSHIVDSELFQFHVKNGSFSFCNACNANHIGSAFSRQFIHSLQNKIFNYSNSDYIRFK